MFLRFDFASTENNWSKIIYIFNEFSLLISLQFSLEIVRVFKKGKEKKILLLESLRDRSNCITIVSSSSSSMDDGKIRVFEKKNWENKIVNFGTKLAFIWGKNLSMEIFDRIGMHFKNEITARNLRTARTRCFWYTWPAEYLLRMHSRRYTCSTDLSLRREIKTKGIKSSVIDGLKRERGREREKEKRAGHASKVLKYCRTKAYFPCARKILIKRREGGGGNEVEKRSRKYKYYNIDVYIIELHRTLLVRLRGKCLKLGNEGPSSLYNEIYNPLRSNKMLLGTRG